MNLDTFFADWLRTIDVKPKTRATYSGTYRKHLAPGLGRTPVADLTALAVTKHFAALRAAGVSAATRRLVRSVLSTAMNAAVNTWRVAGANPVLGTRSERVPKRAHSTWSRTQRGSFLAATKHDDLHALYALASVLGLRLGEALALRWMDLDLPRGTLTVNHTLVEIDGVVLGLHAPKSAESRRTLKLPIALVHILASRRGTAAPTDHVFSTEGRPMHRSTLHRHYHAAVEAAGLPEIRFHDLRHTAATILLEDGVPVKTVSRVLGHASTAVTMDVYANVIEAHEDAANAAMASAFEVAA